MAKKAADSSGRAPDVDAFISTLETKIADYAKLQHSEEWQRFKTDILKLNALNAWRVVDLLIKGKREEAEKIAYAIEGARQLVGYPHRAETYAEATLVELARTQKEKSHAGKQRRAATDR